MGSVTLTWQPLTQWPAGRRRTTFHADANFTRLATALRTTGATEERVSTGRQRIPLSRTLADLNRELSMIGVTRAIVQIDVAKDRDLTRLADLTNVRTPAVVLSFTRKDDPLVFACDHFKRWQDNLRAIALGLHDLRRIERYHIGQAGAEYTGWKALPATTTTTLTAERAAALIASAAASPHSIDDILRSSAVAKGTVRAARARTHPDRNNGDRGSFDIVESARSVLVAHHGVEL